MMPPQHQSTLGGTMNTWRAACAALLVAATATACGGSGEPETIRVTVTQIVTASPSSAAPKTTDGALKMGATKSIDDAATDVHATVQAIEYQQPYKGPQPEKPQDFQGGDTWATVRVKVCNVSGTSFTVDQFPWSLAYTDGTSIQVTGSSGGDMPKPEYPMDKKLTPGRCAAGLVAFPVPGAKRPERLVYQPGDGDPTEWAIPKA